MSLQKLYTSAVHNTHNGQYAEAIRKLQLILTNEIGDGDRANICFLLGGLFLTIGNNEEGVKRLGEALAIAPNNAAAWSNLSEGWRRLGRPDNALETARKALALKPDNADAHNNMGVALKALGKTDEAIASFYRAVALKPGHKAHINLGNTLQTQGKFDEAVASYRNVLILEPDNVEAHNNLGVALQTQGKLDEALVSFRHALKLKPDYANVHNNMGVALQAHGRLDDAITSFRQALALDPGHTDAYNNMGAVLLAQKKFDEAITLSRKALALKSDNADAYFNIGNALEAQGKLHEAIASFRQVLTLKPDNADAHYNIGNALKAQGNQRAAITSYHKALTLRPDHANTHNNMGLALQDQGKLDEAIISFRQALALKPGDLGVYFNIGNLLNGVKFIKPNKGMSEIIQEILEKNNLVRPINISGAALSLLKQEPLIKKLIIEKSNKTLSPNINEKIFSLSKIPLLMTLMRLCPITDLDLEALLIRTRFELLKNLMNLKNIPEIIQFQISLSMQCFINEYLYDEMDIEREYILDLENRIKNKVERNDCPTANEIACLASYKPLGELSWLSHSAIPTELNSIYLQQVFEPKKENSLKLKIPKLKNIKNNISSKVRDQYEQNPYPRWINIDISKPPRSIVNALNESKIKIQNLNILEINTPKILVAGCGTGQHSIFTAKKYKDCQVLAIDISLNSLAYAKRKTEELKVTNIQYMHADILDLETTREKFDIIECSGVLHHMEHPMAGWTALVRCLNSGGLMKIGLYSKLARPHITQIRNELNNDNAMFSVNYTKLHRNRIINSEKEHHKRILSSPDFYSMSSIRDLLFHVQEHQFTIPKIKDCLQELGLIFCGFEHTKQISEIINNSKEVSLNNMYDLDTWERYETKHPRTFAGMYQFWCQKI